MMNGTRNRPGMGAIRKALKAENLKWPKVPVPVPREQWPGRGAENRFAVWRSRDFVVQAFHEAGDVIRLSVNRTDVNERGEWKDDISWDDLQRIKRLVGYGDRDAVEVYPADSDLVNVANMRHLWLLPEPLPFKWTN